MHNGLTQVSTWVLLWKSARMFSVLQKCAIHRSGTTGKIGEFEWSGKVGKNSKLPGKSGGKLSHSVHLLVSNSTAVNQSPVTAWLWDIAVLLLIYWNLVLSRAFRCTVCAVVAHYCVLSEFRYRNVWQYNRSGNVLRLTTNVRKKSGMLVFWKTVGTLNTVFRSFYVAWQWSVVHL